MKQIMRRTIVLDVDGVLGDFIFDFLTFINWKNKSNVLKKDITDWNLCLLNGICKKDFNDFLIADNFENMSLRPGAVDFVKEIDILNYKIYICTAIQSTLINSRVNWLRKNFGVIPEKNFIFTQNKEIIVADIFIDDAFHNLENNNSKIKIMVSQPWNASYSDFVLKKHNIIRIKEFSEIFKIIAFI
jgi:5'(3')-deoxyribonucleotidase